MQQPRTLNVNEGRKLVVRGLHTTRGGFPAPLSGPTWALGGVILVANEHHIDLLRLLVKEVPVLSVRLIGLTATLW